MQTTVQKFAANADSKGLGDVTILLHRFSAELRKAQQKKAARDEKITNFFQRVKDPKITLKLHRSALNACTKIFPLSPRPFLWGILLLLVF
jgi:hypothetical protein